MEWAQRMRMRRFNEPILIQLYSEVLQTFRLAAQGKAAGRGSRPSTCASASRRYFDPLPFYYAPLEAQAHRPRALSARTRSRSGRWRCTTRGIRRTRGCARSTRTTTCSSIRAPRSAAGIADGGWMWVESQWGTVRCMARYSEAVEPGTVWTWNAIGKAPGAWRLAPDANEVAARLPAQPPDLRRAAGAGSGADLQLRSDHRPGRLVRRARAHRTRPAAEEPHDDVAAVRAAAPRSRASQRVRRAWQAFVAGAEDCAR